MNRENLAAFCDNHPIVSLVSVIIICIICSLLSFVGLHADDDVGYVTRANEIITGDFTIKSMFSPRTAIYLPICALSCLFGGSYFTYYIYNYSLAVILLIFIYLTAKLLVSRNFGLISVLIAGTSPLFNTCINFICPEIGLTLMTTAAVYFWLLYDKSLNNRNLFYCGICISLAHMFKVNAALIYFPVLLCAILRKRVKFNLIIMFLPFICTLLFECSVYYKTTSDPFFRFNSSMFWLDSKKFFEGEGAFSRLTYEMPSMFLNPLDSKIAETGLLVLSALIGLIWLKIRNESSHLWNYWMLTMILFFTYWPASVYPYAPALPLYPRYFLIILPPAVILITKGLNLITGKRAFIVLAFIIFASNIFFINSLFRQRMLWLQGPQNAFEICQKDSGRAVYSDIRTNKLFNAMSGFKNRERFNVYKKDSSTAKNSLIVFNFSFMAGHPKEYKEAYDLYLSGRLEKIYEYVPPLHFSFRRSILEWRIAFDHREDFKTVIFKAK